MSPADRAAYTDILAKIEEACRPLFAHLNDREQATLRHALENIRATRAAGTDSAC
jgi:hypothetical protein